MQKESKIIYMGLLFGASVSPISLNKSTSFILTGYETGFNRNEQTKITQQTSHLVAHLNELLNEFTSGKNNYSPHSPGGHYYLTGQYK